MASRRLLQSLQTVTSCDLEIQCGDGRLQGQRLLLAAASPLLRQAMAGLAEVRDGLEQPLLVLPWAQVASVRESMEAILEERPLLNTRSVEVLRVLGIEIEQEDDEGLQCRRSLTQASLLAANSQLEKASMYSMQQQQQYLMDLDLEQPRDISSSQNVDIVDKQAGVSDLEATTQDQRLTDLENMQQNQAIYSSSVVCQQPQAGEEPPPERGPCYMTEDGRDPVMEATIERLFSLTSTSVLACHFEGCHYRAVNKNPGRLMDHIRAHFKAYKPWLCSKCGKRSTSKTLAISHSRLHRHPKVFSTSQSGDGLNQAPDSRQGQEEVVNGRELDRSKSKENVVESPAVNGFCRICQRLLSDVEVAERENVKAVVCEQCSNSSSVREQSVEARHSLEKEASVQSQAHNLCNSCGKTFHDRRDLSMHETSVHGERCVPCRHCTKLFPSARHREKHERSVHAAVAAHQCAACGRGYRHASSLHKHVLAAHGGPEARRHKCAVCDKAFLSRGKLESHAAIHTAERRHCCPHCGQRFTDMSAMTRHKRTHEGGPRYSCDLCSKTYSQSYDVVKHRAAVHAVVNSRDVQHPNKGKKLKREQRPGRFSEQVLSANS